VDVVEALDTREIEAAYRGGGSAPYPPKMLLALLFYCYLNSAISLCHKEGGEKTTN
jgi:transposase